MTSAPPPTMTGMLSTMPPAAAVWPRRARRWLREPLLWFFLAGGVCYALYAAFGQPRTPIVVDAQIRTALAEDYRLLNGRAPDDGQLERLVRDHVSDEMLFHEALRRELLVNDGKTRERMIEKMRYMLSEAAPAEPRESDLLDFYARHRDGYTSEYRLDFEHVFFERPPADAAGLLTRLEAGESVRGDDFWLGGQVHDYSESMLRGMLGEDFVAALHAADDGRWHGPLASSRGIHYVRVRRIVPPALVPYAGIREQVMQDWMAEQRERSVAARLDEVRDRYDVQILR